MGVSYNEKEQSFMFDFGHDGIKDISTLNEILRTLRILNEDNNITIFSIMGRNDLMADAY